MINANVNIINLQMRNEYAKIFSHLRKRFSMILIELRNWCDQQWGRRTWLAKKMGISESHLSAIIDGSRQCKLDKALLIQKHTKWAISLEKTIGGEAAEFWRDCMNNKPGKQAK